VLAAGLSGVFSLAQVLHIIRRKSTTGLSDVTWLLLVLTFTTGYVERSSGDAVCLWTDGW
jgi:uncharacterized membrane protein